MQIDLEDAQGELSALQVKASRMADAIDSVSQKIRHNANLKPSPNDFELEFELRNRVSPQSQADLSYDGVIRIIEELKAARQKVVNLERQRNQLAQPEGWSVNLT